MYIAFMYIWMNGISLLFWGGGGGGEGQVTKTWAGDWEQSHTVGLACYLYILTFATQHKLTIHTQYPAYLTCMYVLLTFAI